MDLCIGNGPVILGCRNEWLFTERPFTFKNQDYDLNAIRLDTNKDFSKFKTGKLIGTIAVTEEQDSLDTL